MKGFFVMTVTGDEARKLFEQGRYEELNARYFDTCEKRRPETSPSVIASLSMTGRLNEAVAMAMGGANADLSFGIFFLSLNLYRSGRKRDACQFLKRLRADQGETGETDDKGNIKRFYLVQARAVFKFYEGAYVLAGSLAERALSYALRLDDNFARLLATDLLGHAQGHAGDLRKALRTLQTAQQIASSAGCEKHIEAIDVTLSVFRSRLGDVEVTALETQLGGEHHDFFSRTNLLLELSARLLKEGRWTCAKERLKEARARIETCGTDVQLRLVAALDSKRTSVFDRLATREPLSLIARQECLERNDLSQLMECLPKTTPSKFIATNVVPGVWLIGSPEGLKCVAIREDSQTAKIYRALAQKQETKEELITALWGYDYDPGRHDSVLYSAIQAARKCLAPIGDDWIIFQDRTYGLDSGVGVFAFPNPCTETVERAPSANSFNLRQASFLENFTGQSPVSTQGYAQRFHVAETTAQRDLKDLLLKGVLRRAGRGSATCYELNTTHGGLLS